MISTGPLFLAQVTGFSVEHRVPPLLDSAAHHLVKVAEDLALVNANDNFDLKNPFQALYLLDRMSRRGLAHGSATHALPRPVA